MYACTQAPKQAMPLQLLPTWHIQRRTACPHQEQQVPLCRPMAVCLQGRCCTLCCCLQVYACIAAVYTASAGSSSGGQRRRTSASSFPGLLPAKDRTRSPSRNKKKAGVERTWRCGNKQRTRGEGGRRKSKQCESLASRAPPQAVGAEGAHTQAGGEAWCAERHGHGELLLQYVGACMHGRVWT
jgi:hypothetical protein